MSVKDKSGNIREYRLLALLEFSSERKRMSVIVEYNNEYYMYMKGADSFVSTLANKGSIFLEDTQKGIDKFGHEGLRTLMVAMKKIEK